MKLPNIRRRARLVIAGLLVLGAVAGIAYASIPGPDGVIHGCYKTSTPAQGALITIDSAASCPSGYTALNWNQVGPQGPAGPGATSATVTRVQHYDSSQGGGHFETVTCPSGTHAVNGSVAQSAPDPGWAIPPPNSGAGYGEGNAYTFITGKENSDGPPYLALPRSVDSDAGWRMGVWVTIPWVQTNSGNVYYGLDVTLYAICL
jgi:hypothetical protein